jgi:hypothetical protein
VSFNSDLGNPSGWTAAWRLLHDVGWGPGYYPQVIGLGPGETDTMVGQSARLYVQGRSKWEVVFSKVDSGATASEIPESLPESSIAEP